MNREYHRHMRSSSMGKFAVEVSWGAHLATLAVAICANACGGGDDPLPAGGTGGDGSGGAAGTAGTTPRDISMDGLTLDARLQVGDEFRWDGTRDPDAWISVSRNVDGTNSTGPGGAVECEPSATAFFGADGPGGEDNSGTTYSMARFRVTPLAYYGVVVHLAGFPASRVDLALYNTFAPCAEDFESEACAQAESEAARRPGEFVAKFPHRAMSDNVDGSLARPHAVAYDVPLAGAVVDTDVSGALNLHDEFGVIRPVRRLHVRVELEPTPRVTLTGVVDGPVYAAEATVCTISGQPLEDDTWLRSADVSVDGVVDKTKSCDGMSWGTGYHLSPATLVGVAPRPVCVNQ
jgi:hypothetical protein